MAFVNPWVLYIGIPVIVFLLVLRLKKKERKYQEGIKVANASVVENTPYYKKLYKKYRLLSVVAMGSMVVVIVLCWILLAQPAKIDTFNPELHNRDIMLCLDISTSMDEVNIKICKELQEVVKELDGERFGISIFNGQSVLLVPLTTDYDYVLRELQNLEKSLKETELDFSDLSSYYYKYAGTMAENGSSFIGDGLVSALYNFPDLEENEERTRLIIFTTDNELNGVPLVSLEDATKLCKKKSVRVYAMSPEFVADEQSFQMAIEGTGGGFYKVSQINACEKLLQDIRKTTTSVLETTQTQITGKPQGFFIWILICLGMYMVICKVLKLG